jgi:epoxyqueuosine reductase QueG
MMELDEKLKKLASDLGADFYGVSDIGPAREEVLRQGGEETASYARAVSTGIALSNTIVDRLPQRQNDPDVAVNYLVHCYDVVNTRLDIMASRLAGMLQREGYRSLPLPSHEHADDERICAQFSHKLAAHLAGLGWIGKSCLLVTPEIGPRARWITVLTDTPLEPTGEPLEKRCGDCNECVDICPQQAFTGRAFRADEPRESRYDARKCERYLHLMKEATGRAACGLCVYACPYGRHERRPQT